MEEDYKLFQLIRRNPINNCVDLSKNMIGKRSGFIYFTENFRIDFENKMANQARLQEENERLQKENEELKEYIMLAPNLDEMTAIKYRNIQKEAYIRERAEEQKKVEQIIYENYISVQKVKDKIIDLMAKMINNNDIDEDICNQMGQKENCTEFADKENCKACIKKYFENKVKESEEK